MRMCVCIGKQTCARERACLNAHWNLPQTLIHNMATGRRAFVKLCCSLREKKTHCCKCNSWKIGKHTLSGQQLKLLKFKSKSNRCQRSISMAKNRLFTLVTYSKTFTTTKLMQLALPPLHTYVHQGSPTPTCPHLHFNAVLYLYFTFGLVCWWCQLVLLVSTNCVLFFVVARILYACLPLCLFS